MGTSIDLEPAIPEASADLLERADVVIRQAAKLEGLLPKETRRALAPTIRTAHTYYSNLIEGHDSTLREIDDATAGRWATERARRAVQEEAIAHLAVLRWQDEALGASSPPRPTDPAFLLEMHRRFYEHMPEEFRIVTLADTGRKVDVGPGEWRTEHANVAGHDPPPHNELERLLRHFDERYRPDSLSPGPMRLIAAAASHQRLLWIHPFRDGNGRVARLFSDGYLRSIRLDAGGVWTPTRYFARDRETYYGKLGAADSPRLTHTDRRGARSERRLHEWCDYFLGACADQLTFMTERLAPEGLIRRIEQALLRDDRINRSAANASKLLGILVRNGSLARTEVYRELGMSERTGRSILSALRRAGWVTELRSQDARREPVAVAIPLKFLPVVCPDLFPTSALAGLEIHTASTK